MKVARIFAPLCVALTHTLAEFTQKRILVCAAQSQDSLAISLVVLLTLTLRTFPFPCGDIIMQVICRKWVFKVCNSWKSASIGSLYVKFQTYVYVICAFESLLQAVPYSREFKQKYDYFRKKLKKPVSNQLLDTLCVLLCSYHQHYLIEIACLWFVCVHFPLFPALWSTKIFSLNLLFNSNGKWTLTQYHLAHHLKGSCLCET